MTIRPTRHGLGKRLAIFDVLTNVEAITCKLIYIVIHEQKVKQLSSQCIKICKRLVERLNFTISHRKRKQERTVDALALGGDEGRGKLR